MLYNSIAMKHHKYLVLIIVVALLVPIFTYAQSFGISSLKAPFGGRVLIAGSASKAFVTCTALYGPITIQPFNFAPPAIYFFTTQDYSDLASKENEIKKQLSTIRSLYSYQNGTLSQADQDEEIRLVEDLKKTRESMSKISQLTNRPKVSGYILGLYNAIPDLGTCYNTETGVPVPAFKITLYGVSR